MRKADAAAAYAAGRASASVVWDDDATDEQRTPGAHHCPFPVGDPQRVEWLRGLQSAMELPQDPATVLKSIKDDLEVADRASR